MFDVKKYRVEIDGIRYPKDSNTSYVSNDYLDQYRDAKLFSKEYLRESLLYTFITYADISIFCPIQVIDSRFQVDCKPPLKFQVFDENRSNCGTAKLVDKLNRHKIKSNWTN